MWKDWFIAPGNAYLFVAITFVVVYGSIIALTRLAGLRSFSKMSAPDFAMTVAVGSLFGSSISNSSPPLPLAVFALACLFGGQWIIAWARKRFDSTSVLLDNSPILLMEGAEFLESNMARAHVTKADIRAKLREANVLKLTEVRAVVFEATGDVSVLHSADEEITMDRDLLLGVQR